MQYSNFEAQRRHICNPGTVYFAGARVTFEAAPSLFLNFSLNEEVHNKLIGNKLIARHLGTPNSYFLVALMVRDPSLYISVAKSITATNKGIRHQTYLPRHTLLSTVVHFSQRR